MHHEILDEIPASLTEEDLRKLKRQKKILAWMYVAICLCVGTYYAVSNTTPSDRYPSANIVGGVIAVFLCSALPGLLLGLLIAFIPYKIFTYRQRYVRAFLICAIVFSLFVSLALLSSIRE